VLTNEDKTELRSVINSGHTRGDGVLRCITDEHKPELFSTFCPKAIGMIGRKMPPQTLARCIAIEMRRRKKSELVQKFKHADDDELKNLRSRLFRWSMNNAEALRNVDPAMPETFDDRQADNWRVQLAIADLAGDDWGDKARIAARQIEAGSDTRSASVKALAAIKTIFEDTKADAIRSQELVDTLASDPTSEWAEWRNGKPISQNGLARLLKPFKIFPQQIWINGTQLRGYVRAWFVEAWEREL